MKGILLAILAGILFGLYNYAIKLSANQIHQILGAVVLQAIALFLGIVALFYLKINGTTLEWQGNGLKYAIIAGLLVGMAEIVSFYVYSTGIKASVGITIIIGITVLTGMLAGLLLSKETLNTRQIVGAVLLITGILLLSKEG